MPRHCRITSKSAYREINLTHESVGGDLKRLLVSLPAHPHIRRSVKKKSVFGTCEYSQLSLKRRLALCVGFPLSLLTLGGNMSPFYQ